MVYYKLIKVTINALDLAIIFINIVMRYYGFPNSIVSNKGFFFTSKFWSLLYYFFSIKQKLFIAFYLQMNSQTEKQNSTIEAYLQVFINFKQNDWARFFSMAEFAYNNTKNTSNGYILSNSIADIIFTSLIKNA